MDNDKRFEDIDRQIEALQAQLDTCHQAILLSRAAIWVGGLVIVLVLTIAGSYRTPLVLVAAFTAVLGGTVWFGANTSSRSDVEAKLADAEAAKAKLIDEVAIRNGWRDITPTVH